MAGPRWSSMNAIVPTTTTSAAATPDAITEAVGVSRGPGQVRFENDGCGLLIHQHPSLR